MKILWSAALALVLSHSVAFSQPARTDADRAAAKQFMSSVQSELKNAERLMKSKPIDAEIGAQSNRLDGLMRVGERLPLSMLQCGALAHFAYQYWWYGIRPVYQGRNDAKADYQRFKADYEEGVEKCEREIGK